MTTPPHPFENLTPLASTAEPEQRARDATAALNAVPELQAWLRQTRQGAVLEMRAGGMSHGEVGKVLGISRARAQQIAEGRTTGKRAAPDAPSSAPTSAPPDPV
jgi:hypothetical protein